MPRPEVAVIVVNYRTEAMSAKALTAAVAAASPYPCEQVLVDNGSTPASRAVLAREAQGATIVALEQNRGFAAGVNAGAAASSAPLLFLVNSDAFARPGAVARLVGHLQAHPRAGLVAPRLSHPDGSLQINAYKRFPNLLTLFADLCLPLHPLHGTRLDVHALRRTEFTVPRRVAHVTGAAMLLRRRAFEETGPFDERFFLYLEETEWQRRLARAGWEVHVDPAAEVEHLERASSGATVVSRHFLVSAQQYHRPPWAARLTMRIAAAVSLAAAAAARALRPRDPRFPKLVSAYRDVLRAL